MKSKQKSKVHPESLASSQQATTLINSGIYDFEEEFSPVHGKKSEEKRARSKNKLGQCLISLKNAIDELYQSHLAEYFAKAQSSQERTVFLNQYIGMLSSLKKQLSEMEETIDNLFNTAKIAPNTDEELKIKSFVKECIAIVREVELECTDFFESTSFAYMEKMIMLYKMDRRYLDQITIDYKKWSSYNTYQLKLIKRKCNSGEQYNSNNTTKSPVHHTEVTEGDIVHNDLTKPLGLNSKNSFKSLPTTGENNILNKISMLSPRVEEAQLKVIIPEGVTTKKKKYTKRRCFLFF